MMINDRDVDLRCQDNITFCYPFDEISRSIKLHHMNFGIDNDGETCEY